MNFSEPIRFTEHPKVGVILRSVLPFILLGPLLPVFFLGPIVLVIFPISYIIGFGPAALAGLIHGIVLGIADARKDLFGNDLRSRLSGAVIGAFSGFAGTFFFLSVSKTFQETLQIQPTQQLCLIGMTSGALCGTFFTPWIIRQYRIEKYGPTEDT